MLFTTWATDSSLSSPVSSAPWQAATPERQLGMEMEISSTNGGFHIIDVSLLQGVTIFVNEDVKQRVYGRINKWLYSGFGTWTLGSTISCTHPKMSYIAWYPHCLLPCVLIYLSIYLSIYLIIVASTRPAFQAPFALQRTTFLHRTASRWPRDLQDIPASFAIPDISSRAMSLSSTQLHWLSLYRLDHCCGSYSKS